MFFLSHCCQESFHSLGISPSHLQDVLQHCADLWICCGDSSNSNLVLFLCVLDSNVHSYQNQFVFFCWNASPFVYSIVAEFA